MRKFEKYLIAAVAITMVFMANTVNAAFRPMTLRENSITSKFSSEKGAQLPSAPSKSGFHASSEKTMGNIADFWKRDANTTERQFNEVNSYKDFASEDGGNLTELVIGVNNANPGGYNNLVNVVSQIGGKVVNTVSIKGKVIALVVNVASNAVSSFIKDVETSDLTRYIEPNMKFQAQFFPNDPYWSMQWGPQKIEADAAWDTTTGDPSVLVAVIDTGIDYTHSDLADNYVTLGYDWVNNDPDPIDDNGHGTHCAGIIAAVLDNSIGIAGLAQVRVMAEKGLDADGYGSEDDLANAIIDAVDKGANILSNSWGGYSDSILIHEAVKYAFENGVLVVAAAGNQATSTKSYPAAYDEVIAVTATDVADQPADFTNFGDWVEVAAPGVDIYSTFPGNAYYPMSGTSMACPHVSGVAALIWSQFPDATRDWVRIQLRRTADDLGDQGFDEYYGYGRINARKAVEQAPSDHDLLIFDWTKPNYIQPGDLASFNITVFNFGVNDEQDITVQLLINDGLVDSTAISNLTHSAMKTVNLSWLSSVEGTYNVTFYIVPVSGETIIENNIANIMARVRWVIGFVLFDQAHNCDLIDWYSIWVEGLTNGGYFVDTYSGGIITLDVLVGYDILVIPQPWTGYLEDEITAIENFVFGGGGLLVIGDDVASIYTTLTDFAGISWEEYTGEWPGGPTTFITPHEITENVSRVYFGAPLAKLVVSFPAVDLIIDGYGDGDVMLAVSEVGAGRVIAIADENTLDDVDVTREDNLQLAYNMMNWLLGVTYEHELVAIVNAPSYLEPNLASILNATVYNRGLQNETNIELSLLINSALVGNATVPLLVAGTKYTINYTWTPSVTGIYNVTAYVSPVLDENVTLNNVMTKFVNVRYPLINPIEGQYANYIINYYDSLGYLIGSACWNFTYDHYVEPYRIYISVWYRDPSGGNGTDWMITYTMNRFVESGMWASLWYPGWIETDVGIGSTVNIVYGTGTISDSKVFIIGARVVDCWQMYYSEYGYSYTFWHDKASGLWISMESSNPYTGERIELMLADTNIPIGTQYERDLGVSLEAPASAEPDETIMLNATIYNLGAINESDVEIHLLINGTEVASEILDELANGTYHTIGYSWTPATEGIYNITAYVPSVPNENVTANNVATVMVDVKYIDVALISEFSELAGLTLILDSMGVGYDVYNFNYFNHYTEDLDLLRNYKAVIYCAGSRWLTTTEYSTLESYLSLGGNLLVTGVDSLFSDTLLASLVRSSSTGDDNGEYSLYVVDETHPIMNGPYGSFSAGYNVHGLSSNCDMAEADTASGALTVAELADGYDRIIATEGLPGKVVFWNGDGTYDWYWVVDCQTMFKNLVYWFTARYEHELVVSLDAPRFLEPGDSVVLNATVQNQGINDEFDVELQLLIDGIVVKSETVPSLINGTSYTLSYVWKPAIAGEYNITAYAPPLPSEQFTRNNVFSRIVVMRYAPKILAYVEYTDYYEDYWNTLAAIQSTFGPNYKLTELWDYTQLDSMLRGKDILLIPDQEYSGLYEMQMIGVTWSNTLVEFLERGGIIILCDSIYGYGGTYGILTGAGLMQISDTNYRSYYTLYLVDSTDPLADGISSSFISPYHTISFVTQERNIIVDDGDYPVVIHKEVGRGQIALLGFDFESYIPDTQQLIGNAVAQAVYITVSVEPSGGSPGAEAIVTGTKATVNGTVSIYWDGLLLGNTTANNVGDFSYELTVPSDATVGLHEIMALDVATGKTALTTFKVMLITLNPDMGPTGTKVTVNGSGFLPESQATLTFNDMFIGYAAVDNFGNFTFTFNIPLSNAGVQTVKALDADANYAFSMFTVVDVTPLDVEIDVGAIHFLGEIAEFYAQTTFRGEAVNATITSAVLYKPDGTTEELTAQPVATGLCKIVYTILGNETGTYTLVLTARYVTDVIDAKGTSFKSFLVSNTLTLMSKQIVEIKDGIALIQMDLGFIKLNLTAMNVTLENIFLKVIAINRTTATMQTTLGIVNGTITSIKNNVATIIVPGVGQIETDISNLMEAQETWTIPQYAIVILALIAAVSSTLSLILMRRRKKTGTN